MTKHAPNSTPLTLPELDQQFHFFGEYLVPDGIPHEWARTEFGEPEWILSLPHGEAGQWAPVVPLVGAVPPHRWRSEQLRPLREYGALYLPSFGSLVREQRGELEEWGKVTSRLRSARSTAQLEAVTREVMRGGNRGPGNPGIRRSAHEVIRYAAWLADGAGLGGTDVANVLCSPGRADNADRRRAVRYVDAGRRLLNGAGVLPWALWQDGRVPNRWWISHRFLHALNVWYGCAILLARDYREIRERQRRFVESERRHQMKLRRQSDRLLLAAESRSEGPTIA